MRRMILVLDESGEKQYSNKPETQLGDCGVMAGIFLTERGMDELSNICKELFSSYFSDGKRHITDIENDQRESLRNDVIQLFESCGIRWFYEAIYSQGFHENFHSENRLGHMTYHGEKKHLLHAKLFRGMFHKSIDIIAQGGTEATHIKVVTDTVDKSIVRKFETEAEDLTGIWLGRVKTQSFTSYDPKDEKVTKMHMSASMSLEGIPTFDKLSYEIHCEDTDLTFLADILANMTRYYLLKAQGSSPGLELNSRDAIFEHPLRDLAVTCGPEGQFTDKLYRRDKT